MGFFEISEQILNKAFTENGDKAFRTTGSACLDYFSLVGGMRFNSTDSLNLFMKAYFENPIIAIKLLFYVRDIRTGLGERNLFRYHFNALVNMYPNVGKQLVKYIPEYGRFDDLLVALNTPIKNDIIDFIKNQLEKDLEAKNNNHPISLLAKWLPSINASSEETKKYAKIIASNLGMKNEEYRKTLSFLRKGLIIENNLREKDYTFDYEKVPGGAMMKYRNAFIDNDYDRYNDYLYDLSNGKTKMNTKSLYPYEVIRKIMRGVNEEEKKVLDAIWKNFDRTGIDSKTIVVRDGSASMVYFVSPSPIDVATSLAILFSEKLTGEFKDKFITFSKNPSLVSVKGETIYDKCHYVYRFDDWSNTNIKKVYDLVLSVYKHKDFKKEDALDRIVIISDMEFDCIDDGDISTYEYFKNEFSKLGFNAPEIVFWNVRARNVHFPVTNEKGVKLISGASAKIISMVTENISVDPYEFMMTCLEKYSCFDSIEI